MLGAQAALSERPRPELDPRQADRSDRELRERLIGLAHHAPVDADGTLTPEAVVKRAATYYEFVQGGTDGRAG